MTPAQLRQVQQRLRARRRRVRRTTLPRMREPSDLAYRSDLLALTRRCQREIMREFEPWLRARTDASRLDGPADELRSLFARIRVKVEQIVQRAAPALAARFVRDFERQNRRNMNEQYATLLRIEPFASHKGLERVMRQRVRDNVQLITSIPRELLADVEDVVRPAVTAGLRVEQLKRQVRERFAVSDSRAQLIARDQVGKFNGELALERSKSLGVQTYVWSTSKDVRVRLDHAALEGTVQRYDTPPVVDWRTGRRGHPGEDYQCRCQPLPQVEALLDALGVSDDVDVVDDDS